MNPESIHHIPCRQPQLQLVGSSKAPSCIADMATSSHMGAEAAFICQDGSVHLLLLHQDSFAQAEAEQEGKEGQLPLAQVLQHEHMHAGAGRQRCTLHPGCCNPNSWTEQVSPAACQAR